MIATLRGEITQIEDNAIIVETGGVGLRVFVPKAAAGTHEDRRSHFPFHPSGCARG